MNSLCVYTEGPREKCNCLRLKTFFNGKAIDHEISVLLVAVGIFPFAFIDIRILPKPEQIRSDGNHDCRNAKSHSLGQGDVSPTGGGLPQAYPCLRPADPAECYCDRQS